MGRNQKIRPWFMDRIEWPAAEQNLWRRTASGHLRAETSERSHRGVAERRRKVRSLRHGWFTSTRGGETRELWRDRDGGGSIVSGRIPPGRQTVDAHTTREESARSC